MLMFIKEIIMTSHAPTADTVVYNGKECQERKFPQQDEEDIPDLTGFKAMKYYFPCKPMTFADWYS